MAILSKGTTFSSSDQVTSTKLNNLVDAATFVSGASGTTDDSTLEVNGSGRLQVKDLGIVAGKIASNAVTTAKIQDGQVTYAKLSTGAPTWDGTQTLTLSFADVATTALLEATALTTNKNPQFRVDCYTGGNSGSGVTQLRTARGTKSSPTAVQTGDTLGQHVFAGHDGTAFEQVARIIVVAMENFSGTQSGVTMRFQTNATGATSEVERMRISETGGVLIGTTTDVPSASLALGGTDKGFRLPVLTTVQRDAIASPAEGLLVYNTTTNKLNFYNGSAWEAVTSA